MEATTVLCTLGLIQFVPFSLFMFGFVRNQERDEAKIAATQNSPPLDLLGEIWGVGLALLQEEERIEKFSQRKRNTTSLQKCYCYFFLLQ